MKTCPGTVALPLDFSNEKGGSASLGGPLDKDVRRMGGCRASENIKTLRGEGGVSSESIWLHWVWMLPLLQKHGGIVHVPTGKGWAASYPEQCIADWHAWWCRTKSNQVAGCYKLSLLRDTWQEYVVHLYSHRKALKYAESYPSSGVWKTGPRSRIFVAMTSLCHDETWPFERVV